MFFPLYVYFFAWPWVKTLVWGPPEEFYGPPSAEEWTKLDPDNFYNTWTYTVIKTTVMMVSLAVMMLLMIYFGQEKILYVPGQPIKHIEDNPPRYKNPGERGM